MSSSPSLDNINPDGDADRFEIEDESDLDADEFETEDKSDLDADADESDLKPRWVSTQLGSTIPLARIPWCCRRSPLVWLEENEEKKKRDGEEDVRVREMGKKMRR